MLQKHYCMMNIWLSGYLHAYLVIQLSDYMVIWLLVVRLSGYMVI